MIMLVRFAGAAAPHAPEDVDGSSLWLHALSYDRHVRLVRRVWSAQTDEQSLFDRKRKCAPGGSPFTVGEPSLDELE